MSRRLLAFLVAALGLITSVSFVLTGSLARTPAQKAMPRSALPLVFEPNKGQTDAAVQFSARTAEGRMFFTARDAVLSFRVGDREAAVRMHPVDAAVVDPSGEQLLPGRSSYFHGGDSPQWHVGVPQFGAVRYRGLYPGIDLVFHGNEKRIEYDSVVGPGADPRTVRFQYDGIDSLDVDGTGRLVLHTEIGDVVQLPPVVYQTAPDGRPESVVGRYVALGDRQVGFAVGAYDHSRQLVIDPTLVYSTYLGGSSGEEVMLGVALDPSGNVYVSGYTFSTDFPTTIGVQTASGGGLTDLFVAKLNTAGTVLLYSTYLGGSQGDFQNGPRSIAVDSAGELFGTGYTNSTDFPLVNAFDSSGHAGDGIAFKIAASGTALDYSTYLGGSNGNTYPQGIALDGGGRAFITGITTSSNLPLKNAFDASYNPGSGGTVEDGFVSVLTSAGNALVYSTYLGGSGNDEPTAIAVDAAGDAYVAGGTASPSFPTVNAVQATSRGGFDGFVTEFTPSGSALLFSTYFGGSADEEFRSIAVDTAGNAFVTGWTGSSDYPLKSAFQAVNHGGSGNEDACVTKLSTLGSGVSYSTYLGGSGGFDNGSSIAVDRLGNAYVVGSTDSPDFPVANALQPAKSGTVDAFVTRFDPAGTALDYSTYLNGSGSTDGYGLALRSSGASNTAYIVGVTQSTDFPLVSPIQATNAGGGDGFLAEINDSNVPISADQTVATTEETARAITLSATNPNSRPLTYSIVGNPSFGVLTGTAPNLTYKPQVNFVGTDTFLFQVSDGVFYSNVAKVTILVTRNEQPLLVDVLLATNENVPITIGESRILQNDVDPNGGTLVITGIGAASHGSAAFVGTSLTYTPAAGFEGDDTFAYYVQDTLGLTNSANVDVHVVGVHTVPCFMSTEQATPLSLPVSVLLNCASDADGETLSLASVSNAVNGTVTQSGSTVTFTPFSAFTGLASFQFTVTDGAVAAAGTAYVSVLRVLHPPVALDDSISTNENVTATVLATTLLSDDSDVDGDTLTIEAVGQAAFGTVSMSGGNVSYTPNRYFFGSDRFTYTVRDPGGLVATANVFVTIAHVNQAPVAVSDAVTASENSALSIPASALLANDSDVDGDALAVVSVSSPVNGSVSLAGSTITFTPTMYFHGTASFQYTISDVSLTASASVSVAVLPVDSAPVAGDDSISTSENAPVSVTVASLLANDSDPDGDAISMTAVTQGVFGVVTLSGGNVTYTPIVDFFGSDHFTYTVRDPAGLVTVATVTVTVAHVNQPPTPVNDHFEANEDVPLSIATSALLANDSDVDDDVLSVTLVSNAVNGVVARSGSTITFTPDLHYFGPASFDYTISDGALIATATVTVSVLEVEYTPGVPGISSPGSGAVVSTLTPSLAAVNAVDVNGDALSLEFQVDTDATFSSSALETSPAVLQSGTTTSWTVPVALDEDTVYFWRVRSTDGFSTSDWITSSFFVDATNEPPETPLALSPADGDLLQTLTPTLTVANSVDPEGDAVTYFFEMHRDSATGPLVLSSSGIAAGPGGETSLQSPALTRGHAYVWNVQAMDAKGASSPVSAASAFQVYKKPPADGLCSVDGVDRSPRGAIVLALVPLVILFQRRRRSRGERS